MAAKKKVTKKITRKQAAPKVKRAYNRKPKGEPLPVVDQNGQLMDMAANAIEAYRPSLPELISAVDAIDMRELNVEGRFSVLSMLNNQGFLTSKASSFINNSENLIIALSGEVILLNHVNKLIDVGPYEAAQNCRRITRPTVHTSVDINFSYPAPGVDKIIEVNGLPYQLMF